MNKYFCGLLLAFALPVAFSGCATSRHPTQWEYKTLTEYAVQSEAALNRLGTDGWILASCAFVPKGETQTGLDEYRYVFRRPKM